VGGGVGVGAGVGVAGGGVTVRRGQAVKRPAQINATRAIGKTRICWHSNVRTETGYFFTKASTVKTIATTLRILIIPAGIHDCVRMNFGRN